MIGTSLSCLVEQWTGQYGCLERNKSLSCSERGLGWSGLQDVRSYNLAVRGLRKTCATVVRMHGWPAAMLEK